jgi:hypothetical protein
VREIFTMVWLSVKILYLTDGDGDFYYGLVICRDFIFI